MKRRRPPGRDRYAEPQSCEDVNRAGFAILGVVIVTGLALLIAWGFLAVVLSAQSIGRADVRGDVLTALLDEASADALARLRWGWLPVPSAGDEPFTITVARSEGSGYSLVSYPLTGNEAAAMGLPGLETTPAPASPPSDGADPTPGSRLAFLTLRAWSGAGNRSAQAVVKLHHDALPTGLVVSGQLDVAAALSVARSGVYAGGDVLGREWVTFAAAADADAGAAAKGPADLAHPELFSVCGVHAGGQIFTPAGEVHAGVAPVGDGDVHTGGGPPPGLLALPDALGLASLRCHATDPGAALVDGVLDLGALPVAAGAGRSAGGGDAPADGIVVVVNAPDVEGGLRLSGSRAADACPLTLIVVGAATIVTQAASGQEASLRGAFVVTGDLEIAAPFRLEGSLAAANLRVSAPLTVAFPGPWHDTPPGALVAQIVAWHEGSFTR